MFCRSLFFLLVIVLSVPLQYTDSDYPFGIVKLLLYWCSILLSDLHFTRVVSILPLSFINVTYKHGSIVSRSTASYKEGTFSFGEDCVMVFNATFNTISVISWRSVLLVEETGVPEENHRPAASQWQTLSHNVVSSTPRLSWIRTHNVVICTYCIGSYKSNYHTITTTTSLLSIWYGFDLKFKLTVTMEVQT